MSHDHCRPVTPGEMAQAFHEAYERLAPMFDYRTRPESAVAWENVPQANRDLMVATIRNVLIEQGLVINGRCKGDAMSTIARIRMTDAQGVGVTFARDADDPYKWRIEGADNTLQAGEALWQIARALSERYEGTEAQRRPPASGD